MVERCKELPMEERSAVDGIAVTDADNEYHQDMVLQLADHAEITDPIAPKIG